MAFVSAKLAIGSAVQEVKIAIICPYDLGSNGGVQDQAIRLTDWLAVLGHETVLVGPGDHGPRGAVLLGSTRVVKANKAATPIKLSPRVRGKIAEVLAQVDVAHIHEPLMPSVSLAATRTGDVPKVGTFHADPPRWVRGAYRGTGMLLRRIVSKLDVTTASSPVSRSAIAGFVDARVVPNGIDTSRYGGEPKGPLSVSFLGRDDERKGLDVLLAAWPRVADAVQGATLTVMGAERPSHRQDITFMGRVSEEVKAEELARSEIYCAPNLGGESFGIVVAEALASGCAVIASAIPAFTHVAGQAAEFVSPSDVAALADRIVLLLIDDERRGALQSKALERAPQFDGLAVARLFVTSYEDALAAH